MSSKVDVSSNPTAFIVEQQTQVLLSNVETALSYDSISDEVVEYLEKEAEGVSYLTLKFAKTQVKDFNEASAKKVTNLLNSLQTSYDDLIKLIEKNENP